MYRRLLAAAAILAMGAAAPTTASAEVTHVVQPGDTLWSLAASHDLTTDALAGVNELSAEGHLVAGHTIRIPAPGDAGAPTPSPTAAYTVSPGETLSGIAERQGTSSDRIAWMNGLDPDGPLLVGTTLELPAGSSGASAAPTPAAPDAAAAPVPTQETVAPALVQQIALEHGVSPSLATAIAEQESGFSNSFVSSSDARGVMQLLPGTWEFVQSVLAGHALEPASAQDNVRAGVIYLDHLLRETGGDEVAAVAAYYQGLASIRSIGLLPQTHTYVGNVMALRQKYGG